MSSLQDPLILKYIGEDSWSRPVYKDQFQHIYKDVNCGRSAPSLFSSVNDEFDGEPDMPIDREFHIVGIEVKKDKRFEYMMLDRLRCDCEYYLGYGNRNAKILIDGSPQAHIENMKKRWLEFAEDEKPQWLTWEQILEYEKQMCAVPE